MPRPDRRAGFMLVEVLAALVVTASLVTVVLPYAGRLVSRWQTGQSGLFEADAWMQTIARLGDDVAQARPIHDPDDAAVLAFGAVGGRVDLVRPALGSPDPGELERVTYRVDAVDGGERLVRRAAPLAVGGSGRASEVVLMSGPYRMAFAAIARDGSRQPWTRMPTMPDRLVLTVAGRGARAPPLAPVILPIAAQATVAATTPLLRQSAP